MAKLHIYSYPDDVLSQKAKPILKIEERHRKLAEDMFETMYDAPGVGLAANQVGILERIIVIDTDYDVRDLEEEEQVPDGGDVVHGQVLINKNPIVLINPEIVEREGKTKMKEGCLSVPEFQAEVERSERVTVHFLDLEGRKQSLEAEGLMAVCVQHEIDHLDGKLFIERLSSLKREMAKKKVLKFRQEQELEFAEELRRKGKL